MRRLSLAVLSLAAFVLPAFASSGYIYRRAITVAAAVVPATQTNFPMLVSGTYSFLATFPNGGMIHNTVTVNSQSVPADLIFTSDAAGTIKLNWEIASYTAATGAIEAWVQVPSISNGTVIYMFYSNISVTTYQSTVANVWSGYGGVWHLANGTTLSLVDSSGTGNGLTNYNATPTAGIIDGAASFPGTSAGLYGAAGTGIDSLTTTTYSVWIKPSALTNSSSSNLILINGGIEYYMTSGGAGTIVGSVGTSITFRTATSSTALTIGNWQYVVMTYTNPNAPRIFINGAEVSYASQVNGSGTDAYNTGGAVGTNAAFAGNNQFKGAMDEARISSVARAPSWIMTEYNNQSSPSTFYAIGSPTSMAGTGGTSIRAIIM
jgi:hypothetical protein